mgnify:CR=1 FL=1
MGLIEPNEELVQVGVTSPGNNPMTKYLEIAQSLVKLDPKLPVLKKCMADVKSGLYKPSLAARILQGKKVPAALK